VGLSGRILLIDPEKTMPRASQERNSRKEWWREGVVDLYLVKSVDMDSSHYYDSMIISQDQCSGNR
jgi:hypothetical protein